MDMIEKIFENSFFQNVLSGIIGGIVVYLLQKFSKKKQNRKRIFRIQ